MKRDKDLILRILRHYEAELGYGDLEGPSFPSLDLAIVAYHVHLAAQAGFIEASYPAAHEDGVLPRYRVHGLTWAGHELLHPNGCSA